MNDAAVVGTLSAGSILAAAAAAAASAGDSPEESPLSPATGGSGSESSSSPSAPSSISSSTSGSSASTCEAASPPAVTTGQPPSVAQVLYMPVGLANIKEELPEPEIQVGRGRGCAHAAQHAQFVTDKMATIWWAAFTHITCLSGRSWAKS